MKLEKLYRAVMNYFGNFSLSRIKSRIRILFVQKNRGIKFGDSCYLSNYTEVSTPFGGSIQIGNRCEIMAGVKILTYGGKIIIGNDCSFNPYCIIYGHGGLKIGNGVRIAAHSIIIPANHHYSDRTQYIMNQGESRLGIEIGNNVWIGANVKILDGVKISDGCVIAAGAVVTKSTLENSVYGGVPARFLKSRFE
jgi:acetyltransferase-like isoleucine patch superfamily enzyme